MHVATLHVVLSYSLIYYFIIFICLFVLAFIKLLPARASEQGNLIGLVSMCVHMCPCVYIYIAI